MDAMESRVHDAARKFRGFATLIMKPTIVLDARLVEKF